MSTRCQIVIRDKDENELWFYRHSDGYPEGVKPTLDEFCELVKTEKIRNNTEQAAGWLILIGAKEYNVDFNPKNNKLSNWKVGAYEPCPCRSPHGDIAHFYVVNLETATWEESPIPYSKEI